ncbi:SDR family NAD(P)-dependent oxidoreductase [Sphingomonas sp. RHCKR47]|uniref:SDR family oxidoreductase n=1 Tax=Sphingomonas citricola TaxID=2862498 RepID=UPI001CA4A071|nr:SDR family oxidoreductase [Sphingomonas citricola]MBW6523096.1 SDR family NAD(P)-dependent oxidoreductase [Sphingomonas citricola]
MSLKLKPLDQQVVVITGASSGIGLVTARLLATRGAKLVVVARDELTLTDLVRDVEAGGGEAYAVAADVGDPAAAARVARHAVARFGRIDTWINNAGVAIYAKLLDTPFDEHERLFRTNYFGVVNGCAAAVPHLREHGGALITVASIAAGMPSPLMGAYAASKHAVKGYVDTLRAELLRERAPISVTLIQPSGIDTPVAEHASNHVGGKARIPPVVYDPTLVAEAIVDAATRPTHGVTVGGAGKAQVLFAQHAPALFDRVAAIGSALFVDPTKNQPGPDNLFAPARNGVERSRDQRGKGFSLYTSAMRHPAAMLALGLGLAGAAIWSRRHSGVAEAA